MNTVHYHRVASVRVVHGIGGKVAIYRCDCGAIKADRAIDGITRRYPLGRTVDDSTGVALMSRARPGSVQGSGASRNLKPIPAVGDRFTWTRQGRTMTFERLPDQWSSMTMRVAVVPDRDNPIPQRFHVEPEWFRQRLYEGEVRP